MSAARGGARRMDARGRALAAVHLGKKELGWSDDVYRDVIAQVTRASRGANAEPETSARGLSLEELGRLLDVMRAGGFKRAPGDVRPAFAQSPRREGGSQLAMIRGLWAELEQLGAVRVPGEAGLRAWANARYGVAALEWLAPAVASDMIEALKAMKRRAPARPAP